MAHEIQTKLDGWVALTQTLLNLANAASRLATVVANTNNRKAALIGYKIKSGAVAPTAGTLYEIFLIRGDGAGVRTDNAGATDALFTANLLNAQLIGTLQVTAAAATNFTDFFDTAPLGALGTEFSTVVRNSSGQALSNGAEGDFTKEYNLYVPNFTP
jgi:hypothetical protein